jgi:NADH-quinone oxidoreductase subunit K
VLVRRNLIVVFMAIEIMLNAVNLTFVAFCAPARRRGRAVIVFFVMAVAAAEPASASRSSSSSSAPGKTLHADEVSTLKW